MLEFDKFAERFPQNFLGKNVHIVVKRSAVKQRTFCKFLSCIRTSARAYRPGSNARVLSDPTRPQNRVFTFSAGCGIIYTADFIKDYLLKVKSKKREIIKKG